MTENAEADTPGIAGRLEALAKGYNLVNLLVLIFIGCIVSILFLMPASIEGMPVFFAFPLLFALLNIVLIITTAYLGTKVMDAGWILSLFLSFFGNIITALIFTRLAAGELKRNGYKVGLVKATRPV